LLAIVLAATAPGAPAADPVDEPAGEPALSPCDEVLAIVARLHPAVIAGQVEIGGCARIAGYRTKLVVRGADDPVGLFVGPEGGLIRPIVQALDGETIDVVPHDPDPARAVAFALAPAQLVRIYLDEENRAMDLVVVDQDLDRALGPDGQHLQLVSDLTGWTLHVYTESKELQMRQQARETFRRELGLDEAGIEQLIAWGFLDLEAVAAAEPTELARILGTTADQVHALQATAAARATPSP